MRLTIACMALLSAIALAQIGGPGGPFPFPQPSCFTTCKFDFIVQPPFCGFPIFTGKSAVFWEFWNFFNPSRSDVAITPRICQNNDIFTVGSTGEAFVEKSLVSPGSKGVIGISEVGAGFSPSFFKSYAISGGGQTWSGIGHEAVQGGPNGDQANFFKKLPCIGVPLKTYQVDGKNMVGGDPLTDCVAFRLYSL